MAPRPGGIAGPGAGCADLERDDDLEEEGFDDDLDDEAEGFDDDLEPERDAEVGAGCAFGVASAAANAAANWVGSGANSAAPCGMPVDGACAGYGAEPRAACAAFGAEPRAGSCGVAVYGTCAACGAEPRAESCVCGACTGYGAAPSGLRVCPGCGAESESGVGLCGVLVWGADSSGRCVPGLGILRGRPGGVMTLPGSVGTRGAASIRLREIERLLSRLTATMLWGSGKWGGDGSRSGSPRRLVLDADAEWMLPARAGTR
jgi:hypothetical protein